MKKKKQADWMDHLSESALPDDDFTFSTGSNYGLDGFDFSEPDGQGVEDGARLPSVHGLSGLPDGLVTGEAFEDVIPDGVLRDEDANFNLTAMLSADEGSEELSDAAQKAASLADLAWLDPTQKQDPERLPKDLLPDQPPLNSLPELEEAWGVDRRTTGVALVPNQDKAVLDYKNSIRDDNVSGLPGERVPSDRFAALVRRAVRRSHFGEDIASIRSELVNEVGAEKRVEAALKLIEDEHGVAGKVFIRASAFPGLKNGKWAKKIRARCRTARYVLTSDEAVATKLSMKRVIDVPWRKALAHYSPKLKAAGYKVASKGHPQYILKKAFLRGPAEVQPEARLQPQRVQADEVSFEDAENILFATDAVDQAPVGRTQGKAAQAKKKALLKIERWVAAGKITKAAASKIVQSDAPAYTMVRRAEALVRQSVIAAEYVGDGLAVPGAEPVTVEAAQAKLRKAERVQAKKSAKAEAADLKKAKVRLAKWVKGQLITKDEAVALLSRGFTAEKTLRLATKAVEARRQSSSSGGIEFDTSEYDLGSEMEAIVLDDDAAPVADLEISLGGGMSF